MVCVVYSSSSCPQCQVLKQYLHDKGITHNERIIEEPEARVDALMLNIYSTPALVINEHVLHQTEMFQNGHLDESVLLAFLRRFEHGKA
ncbi:MAG: glutaredoxin family protein [Promethearchaeota archaeon]